MSITANMVDINNYFPYGQGVVNFGICVGNAVNGVGLVTRGLVWQGYDIWDLPESLDNLSTTWTASNSNITTTWTPSNQAITTVWTLSTDGGEFPSVMT